VAGTHLIIHGELPGMQTSQLDYINHCEPFCSILMEYLSLTSFMCGSPGEANPAVVSVPDMAHFVQPKLLPPFEGARTLRAKASKVSAVSIMSMLMFVSVL
jgi:hypothetical protein